MAVAKGREADTQNSSMYVATRQGCQVLVAFYRGGSTSCVCYIRHPLVTGLACVCVGCLDHNKIALTHHFFHNTKYTHTTLSLHFTLFIYLPGMATLPYWQAIYFAVCLKLPYACFPPPHIKIVPRLWIFVSLFHPSSKLVCYLFSLVATEPYVLLP